LGSGRDIEFDDLLRVARGWATNSGNPKPTETGGEFHSCLRLQSLVGGELVCSRAVGEYQSSIPTHSPRWNRSIAAVQANEHSRLLAPSDQPEDASGTIEDRIGQRHPTSLLVGPGYRHICVSDLEDRIAGHQRRGVAVGAEAKMNQV
jgi:hypothetical protein